MLQLHAPVSAYRQQDDVNPFLDPPQVPAAEVDSSDALLDNVLPELETPPRANVTDPQTEALETIPNFSEANPDSEAPPRPESIPGNQALPRPQDLDEETPLQPPTDVQDGLRELPGFNSNDPPPAPDGASLSDTDDSDDDAEDCDRTYNDRNCCDEDLVCEEAWNEIADLTLEDKFDIGIAPPIAPVPEDEMDIEEQRQRLRKAPSRDWRDRSGNVLTSGTLEDLQDGRVVIRTYSGEMRRIPFGKLSRDDLCFVTAWWRLPPECIVRDKYVLRDFTLTTFTWKASGACHKPSYFEDTQLERYGHSAGPVLQPLVSGAHFFASVALLPYNMGVYPPHECRYVLGKYRPGSCAPWMIPAFPLSRRGVATEALGVLGFVGIF